MLYISSNTKKNSKHLNHKVLFVFALLVFLISVVSANLLFIDRAEASISGPCVIKSGATSYVFYDTGTTCGSGSGVKLSLTASFESVTYSGRKGASTFTMSSPNGSTVTVRVSVDSGEVSSTGYQSRNVESAVVTQEDLDRAEKEDQEEFVEGSVNDAILDGFGDSLASVKKKHIEECIKKYGSSGSESNECQEAFDKNVVACTASARSDAATSQRMTTQAGREFTQEDFESAAKISFSSCLAKNTEVGSELIKSAIQSIDLTTVFGSVTDAREQARGEIANAESKEECEEAGGEWDEAVGCTDPNAGTCSISGIGWLLCPIVDFMVEVADKAYGVLSDNFLQLPSSMFSSRSDNRVYKAWQTFQSIANILLVILFLVIIFSQLTSVGITNYGIKKLLPKMIIIVILMNLSFVICALAVDLSNILGKGLKDVFNVLSASTTTVDSLGQKYATGSTGNPWAGILTGAAMGGVGIMASGGIGLAFIAFIPVLFSAVVSLIMIFFILVGRQALIILLTVISPVAFALYLLPNTQGWFTKWRKTFMALLMVFPIIGLVYGVSEMASVLLGEVYGSLGNEMGQVISAGILTIPFFVVPSLLRKSLDSVGNIGGMMGKLNAKMSGGLDKSLQGSKFAQFKGQQRDQKRALANVGVGNGLRARMSRAGTRVGFGGQKYQQSKIDSYAKFEAAQEKENREAAAGWVENYRLPDGSRLSKEQELDLVKTGKAKDASGKDLGLSVTGHQRSALMAKHATTLTGDEAMEIYEKLGSMGDDDRREIGNQLFTSSSKMPVSKGTLAKAVAGTKFLSTAETVEEWSKSATGESLSLVDAGAMEKYVKPQAQSNKTIRDNLANGAIAQLNQESGAIFRGRVSAPQREALQGIDPTDRRFKVEL